MLIKNTATSRGVTGVAFKTHPSPRNFKVESELNNSNDYDGTETKEQEESQDQTA